MGLGQLPRELVAGHLNLAEVASLQGTDLGWRLAFEREREARVRVRTADGAARRSGLLLLSVARQLAALGIFLTWRRLRGQRWMNMVVRDCIRYHMFPNRMSSNYPEVHGHFGRGLAGNSRLVATKRFVSGFSRQPARCPMCRERSIDAASFYSIGCKMVRSSPYLDFGCAACHEEKLRQDEPWYDDYYHSPRVSYSRDGVPPQWRWWREEAEEAEWAE